MPARAVELEKGDARKVVFGHVFLVPGFPRTGEGARTRSGLCMSDGTLDADTTGVGAGISAGMESFHETGRGNEG